MRMIYLDHAAATPVSAKVLEAMQPYFLDDFFNPSAAYLPAKKVNSDYETAKGEIAHAIGAKGNDIVITAGATEANNLAFTAISENAKVLYLKTEHDSVRNPASRFKHEEIEVDQNGRIVINDLKQKIDDSTE